MAACAAVRAECMARAFGDVYVPSQSCLQSYAELFDSLQHRLASVYLSQFPTGFLHIIRAARNREGNSSVLHLNYNINKQGKGSENAENDWLNHRMQTLKASLFGVQAWNEFMLNPLWYWRPMAAWLARAVFWSPLYFYIIWKTRKSR